jgi:hypothetical protein
MLGFSTILRFNNNYVQFLMMLARFFLPCSFFGYACTDMGKPKESDCSIQKKERTAFLFEGIPKESDVMNGEPKGVGVRTWRHSKEM